MGGRPVISVNGESMICIRDDRARNPGCQALYLSHDSVWINDTPVPRDQFDETEVPDGANVQVIHMIGGG